MIHMSFDPKRQIPIRFRQIFFPSYKRKANFAYIKEKRQKQLYYTTIMKKHKIIAFAILCMAMMTSGTAAYAQQPDRPQLERQERYPRPPHRYEYNLSDEDYAVLYNKVKEASFDDNKLDLIEVASLGCYYSCQQTARIIKLFSFDDDKLKALRLMARRTVDTHNAVDIYRQFTFSDDKDKAAKIIQMSWR